jgi:tRNA pseudouridine55 synthase
MGNHNSPRSPLNLRGDGGVISTVMNFIINLNKPIDITSQQAVTRVKRLLRIKKAGHTGTLDPLATGILLICLDEATKISRFLLEMDKRYKARVKLGERTDTYDARGSITERKDTSSLTEEKLKDAVRGFQGRIEQVPPMYSAIKVGGRALYSLARKGIEIERISRQIEIYEIGITAIDLPYFDLFISCSKGTYIRTLCDDIGNKLGTGAHLVSLERQGIGFFDIKDSLTFEELIVRDLVPDARSVFSIDAALSGLDELILNETDYIMARHGKKIIMDPASPGLDNKMVKLKGPDGILFGIGRVDSGIISIERNLNL